MRVKACVVCTSPLTVWRLFNASSPLLLQTAHSRNQTLRGELRSLVQREHATSWLHHQVCFKTVFLLCLSFRGGVSGRECDCSAHWITRVCLQFQPASDVSTLLTQRASFCCANFYILQITWPHCPLRKAPLCPWLQCNISCLLALLATLAAAVRSRLNKAAALCR